MTDQALSLDDMVSIMDDVEGPTAETVEAETIEEAVAQEPTPIEDEEEAPAPEAQADAEDQPEEEAEPEEGEEEGDDEGEDDEGEEPVEVPDDYKLTVKVDGEEVEVTLGELRQGYQRREDYTRKTQELAENRKTVEAAKENMTRQAQAYAQAYLETAENIASFAPSEADIERARIYDPAEAVRLQEQRKSILAEAANAWDRAKELYAKQNETIQEQMAQTAEALPEFVPEWSDLELRKKEIPAIADFLQQEGMTPEVVGNTTSPVAWKIARKAWLYDQLQKNTEAKVQQKPKPATRKTQGAPGRKAPAAKSSKRIERSFAQTKSKDALIELMNTIE